MKTGLKILVALAAVAVLMGAGAWYMQRGDADAMTLRTAQVKRGELLATISATGTVEPEEVIDVGAQVAGQINSFGKDRNGRTIDYGSEVEEGTVLARIDDQLYAADVATAQAQVSQAQAGIRRAEADLQQMKAKLFQAQRDWERAQKLGPSDALAQSSFDAYRSAFEAAQANVTIGDAAIVQAQAALAQAQASLQRAQRNLGYCTIKSPVKGVIIDRRVNIGQTVVASLNAPSLFLIAKDLRRMQVWVAVNEADIGNIKPGLPVTFTVDAFPGQTFRGEVGKVRLNATMTQNVVTYTVEVLTDNSSGTLLPYLTANVRFEISRRPNVLMVPNAALRWTPASAGMVVPEARERFDATGDASDAVDRRRGTVWVQEGELARPVAVQVGISDGTNTEVASDQLREGDPVVTAAVSAGEVASDDARNPFLPQFGRRSQQGGASQPSGGGSGSGMRRSGM